MSRIATIAAGLLIASLGANAAQAHSIGEREAAQARAIEQGRQTGSITWREGLKLRAEQRRIAETEAQYKADGHLDKSERRSLNRMLDESARHISEEKNDGWRRPGWLPRVGR